MSQKSIASVLGVSVFAGIATGCMDGTGLLVSDGRGAHEARAPASSQAVEILPNHYVVHKHEMGRVGDAQYMLGTGPYPRVGGAMLNGPDPDCAISYDDLADEEKLKAYNACVTDLHNSPDCAVVVQENIKAARMHHAHCLA